MTTSTTISTDISNLIRKSLPGWATAGQLSTLTERFGERYEWGWICGDGSAGGAHSQRGAERAASRAAGRAARACGGPAPWTAVIDLETAVEGKTTTTPVGLCSRARAEYLMGAAALAGGAIYVSLQPIAGLTELGEYLCCGTIGGEPVPTTLLDPQDVLSRLDTEAARLERCSPTLFTDWIEDIREAAADLRAKLA